ncbi:MAG: YHS domain-containing protein [Bdellovibrionaceae bacterium]|nr:YHS domain-containing protein [Pseudobdellovibrionaceae bacterium]
MATKAKIQKPGKKVYCGICRDWEIKRPEKCSNTLTHKGTKHYFCTSRCKERFEKTPEKFV